MGIPMLKQLRRRLTLLCACITGVILCVMAFISLMVSEAEIAGQARLAFQNNFSTIAVRIQSEDVLDWAWLAQTEDNRLIIHIEENKHPLLFAGAWYSLTPRDTLVNLAQETAKTRYDVDVGLRPQTALMTQQAVFGVNGDYGEKYRAAVAVLRTPRGFKSLTLLEDTRNERTRIFVLRGIFAAIILSGVTLLIVFSWWFSGRATRPVAESQQRQSEFVAAASHELRAPLAVIRASASALGYGVADETRRFVEAIDRECVRTGRLVDDLLILASVDAKSWSIVCQPVEIDALLREMKEDFAPMAEKKRQSLTVELPVNGLPLLTGDEQRLKQTLAILLDNALQYTQEGGRVLLRGARHGRGIRIQVIDNGPGIANEHKAHVFGRFYRVDKSRTQKENYGLGFSIAQELVRLHSGKIFLQDTEGGGLTVIIDIPLRETRG